MTVRTSALIHFGEGDVGHRWFPGDDECQAYGALKFKNDATVFFDRPAQIDEVIAELVALRAEMAPPGEGGVLFPADRCKCGHAPDSHHLDQVAGELQYCNECPGVDDCAVYSPAEAAAVSS